MKSFTHYFTQMFLHEFDSLHLEVKGLGRFCKAGPFQIWLMNMKHAEVRAQTLISDRKWRRRDGQSQTLCVCTLENAYFLSGQEGKVRENVCASLWERERERVKNDMHGRTFDTVQIKMLKHLCECETNSFLLTFVFIVFHSRQVCACVCDPG